MYRYVYGDAVLELQKGDITRQTDTETIVNAANAFLRPGGGEAATIAIRTIMRRMPDLKQLKLIRMVLFSEDDLEIHREIMKKPM